MDEPLPANWPVIEPVIVPIVQAKVVPVVKEVKEIDVEVPEQIVTGATAVIDGDGLTV